MRIIGIQAARDIFSIKTEKIFSKLFRFALFRSFISEEELKYLITKLKFFKHYEKEAKHAECEK